LRGMAVPDARAAEEYDDDHHIIKPDMPSPMNPKRIRPLVPI
jgi:hypothetical protein